VFAPLSYFIYDRLLPQLKFKRCSKANVYKVSPQIIRLDFAVGGHPYQPGDWVNILIPELSIVNWHPFSISSSYVESPNIVSILIKKRAGWTKQLFDLADGCVKEVAIKV
jgi:predicted ferric reductase